MPKMLNVYVSLSWNTQLELPEGFVETPENIQALVDDAFQDFDFMDGGLDIDEVHAKLE